MGSTILRLFIHLTSAAALVQADLWAVNIDNGPAPLPQDGPPLSAHASRDRSLLPGQICAIIGAYVATVFVLGTLLLTVGRRLRRAAQSVHVVVATEMVKPTLRTFDDSPVSPQSQRSWYSPRRIKKKRDFSGSVRDASSPSSPAVQSVASFDPSVIEADKAARQQELEHLYAAALAQEAARSKTSMMDQGLPSPTMTKQRRVPPRLLTTAPALAHLNVQASQTSPISPRSPIRAIYPPESPRFHMPSPVSPVYQQYPVPNSPRRRMPTSPGVDSTRTRASSFGSQIEGKRPRRGMRGLRLQNTARYPGDVSDEEVRTPLSPRYYVDPNMPPSPPPKSEAPTTPDTHEDYDFRVDVEDMDHVRAMPRPEPQRSGSYQYGTSNPRQMELRLNTGVNGQFGEGRPPISNASASTLGILPFRAMAYSANVPLPSPGPATTKTTYLERRRDLFTGPRTGMATPYSPYMPFTPVTPVTPHLTSRAERKKREKEEGRRALGESDQVIDEDELWGNAY